MNDNFNPYDANKILPRFDLREEAFRRYEPYIAKGLKGSYHLSTIDLIQFSLSGRKKQPIRAHTFCIRFQDAILGYRRFGYKSIVIPMDKVPMLASLRAFEGVGGNVLISNPMLDIVQANSNAHPSTPASNREAVLAICAKLASNEITGKHYISYQGDDEKNFILSMFNQFDIGMPVIVDSRLAYLC